MSKKMDSLITSKDIFRMNGENILEEARDRFKNQYKDRVITFVHATMEQVSELERTKQQIEKQIEFKRRRLKAISLDEFYVNNQGQVVFHEGELNG